MRNSGFGHSVTVALAAELVVVIFIFIGAAAVVNGFAAWIGAVP